MNRSKHIGRTFAHVTASHLAAATALVVAMPATSNADSPADYVLVADSELQFSAEQSQGGWRYQFDRGAGTPITDMPFFLADQRWCATPYFGGLNGSAEFSHCTLTASWGHTNSGEDCQTPAQGTLRPTRSWSPLTPMHAKVRIQIIPAYGGMRFDLIVDGTLAWTRTWANDLPPADEWLDVFVTESLKLVVDPLGSCGGDGAHQLIQIYSMDCNGNGLADAVDIAAGATDYNQDTIPDTCQCLADLVVNHEVNGADLGALLAAWGPANPALPSADINRDGNVDGADLGYLLYAWGSCTN